MACSNFFWRFLWIGGAIVKAAEILRAVCMVRRENGEGKKKCGTEEDFGRKALLYRPVFYSKIFVHSSV